jgi:hypothetical protein
MDYIPEQTITEKYKVVRYAIPAILTTLARVVRMVKLTVVKITGLLPLTLVYTLKGVVNIIGKKWSASQEKVVKMDRNIHLSISLSISSICRSFSLSFLLSPFGIQDQTNKNHTVPETIKPGKSFSEPNAPNKAKVLIKETIISFITNHIAVGIWLEA